MKASLTLVTTLIYMETDRSKLIGPRLLLRLSELHGSYYRDFDIRDRSSSVIGWISVLEQGEHMSGLDDNVIMSLSQDYPLGTSREEH